MLHVPWESNGTLQLGYSAIQNQLQRFSVALTELRGRGQECGQLKTMRPLKMLKDMVDGTAHRYRKP